VQGIVWLVALQAAVAFLSPCRKSSSPRRRSPFLFRFERRRHGQCRLFLDDTLRSHEPPPALQGNATVTWSSSSSMDSPVRRRILLGTSALVMLSSRPAVAAETATASTIASPSLLERILRSKQSSSSSSSSSYNSIAKGRLYVVSAKKNVTISPQRTPLDEAIPSSWGEGDGVTDRLLALSSQICLLRLLPVKNVFFRSLETNIVRLSAVTLTGSSIGSGAGSAAASPSSSSTATISSMMTRTVPREDWTMATERLVGMINEIDSKRSLLAPVFNPQDSTPLAISKGERGEQLIESLRTKLVEMVQCCQARNAKWTLVKQKEALLALSEIGELLVTTFPYDVPRVGKFSYLPRLLGRARVTFTFSRPSGKGGSGGSGGNILGNITIVADGYAAPITAGNFVDLSARQFYTGLPIQLCKKKLGDINSKSPTSEFDVASLPIFGSFQQEGFYDPLTAKPRRIPLEIIRVEKSTGLPSLTYYPQGLPSLLTTAKSSTGTTSTLSSIASPTLASTASTVTSNTSATETNATAAKVFPIKASTTGKTVLEPTSYSEPLLTFNIPGLVAMNHPDNYPNGASAEFFALQDSSIIGGVVSNPNSNSNAPDKRRLLDGEYAPFGYIVEGYDLFQQLQPNDIIEATTIDEWGLLNLVKIRQSSFAQVLESASVEGGGGGGSNTAGTD
jgi:cyclophilin family peptidyl-prolyl cis-trans isomerase